MAFSLSFFFKRTVPVNPVELPVLKQAVGNTAAQLPCAFRRRRSVKSINTDHLDIWRKKPEREETKPARNQWHAAKRKIAKHRSAHPPLQIDSFDTAIRTFCIRTMNFP
jgi:hypothetical protein